MHTAAFAIVLNVPLVHAAHVRSVVRVPSTETKYPGTHAVCGMHGVAALPSWSQVPLTQDSFGAVPPAQYVPASHSAQTGSPVEPPSET